MTISRLFCPSILANTVKSTKPAPNTPLKPSKTHADLATLATFFHATFFDEFFLIKSQKSKKKKNDLHNFTICSINVSCI
ncbi:hypothetical protein B0181_09965 [Moraxella caviae]|uniref:Uncharacterized protein n=1 Tax=Moraxella caviae TaxID=34060 RepID=A0A1S9ZW40_9GAMM|nr:hypothetical protein B0181_09965 [Moraxella caviae]